MDAFGVRRPSHPFKDAFGEGEFVLLGPHFRHLVGQLFFEFVQFRMPRGDPFQQLGIQHAQDRRRRPSRCEEECSPWKCRVAGANEADLAKRTSGCRP
ncbi:hypothetical protein [Streptomyces sp. TLI_146]|uniref:hypothetical protein n=1 Tax=Streptomyces sp. TLI_146 TaxID=1938858 RepID=UPI00117E4B33|nr:hypothetical protein [Streptomyces sp. TLI_146]